MRSEDPKEAQVNLNFTPIPLEHIPEGVRVVEDVPYGAHTSQKVDAYLPKADVPAPVLIEIHGGGWRNGDKKHLGVYRGMIEQVLKAGIAVVAVNYRLTPESCWPAMGEDAVRSVQFVRSKAVEWNLDPDRVGLIGGSAGAHLSMLVAARDDFARLDSPDPIERFSSHVSCVVSCWGPIDLTRLGIEGRGLPIFTQMFRCKPEEWDTPRLLELRKKASPYYYLTADSPPVLIIHDQEEKPLPEDPNRCLEGGHSSQWGVQFKQRMEEVGAPVEAVFGATPETWNPRALAFLRKHLRVN